jgi:exodeoxyribonuclease VII large subunit
VEGLARGLGDPRALLEGHAQRLDDRAERLNLAATALLERRRTRVGELAATLRHPRERLAQAAQRLTGEARALDGALRHRVTVAQGRHQGVAARLSLAPVRVKAGEGERRLTDLTPRLERAYANGLADAAARLASLGQLLESYSYKGVLARGFALVEDREGRRITTAAQATPGLPVMLVFADDGRVGATIDGGEPKAERKAEAKRPRPLPVQGSLF